MVIGSRSMHPKKNKCRTMDLQKWVPVEKMSSGGEGGSSRGVPKWVALFTMLLLFFFSDISIFLFSEKSRTRNGFANALEMALRPYLRECSERLPQLTYNYTFLFDISDRRKMFEGVFFKAQLSSTGTCAREVTGLLSNGDLFHINHRARGLFGSEGVVLCFFELSFCKTTIATFFRPIRNATKKMEMTTELERVFEYRLMVSASEHRLQCKGNTTPLNTHALACTSSACFRQVLQSTAAIIDTSFTTPSVFSALHTPYTFVASPRPPSLPPAASDSPSPRPLLPDEGDAYITFDCTPVGDVGQTPPPSAIAINLHLELQTFFVERVLLPPTPVSAGPVFNATFGLSPYSDCREDNASFIYLTEVAGSFGAPMERRSRIPEAGMDANSAQEAVLSVPSVHLQGVIPGNYSALFPFLQSPAPSFTATTRDGLAILPLTICARGTLRRPPKRVAPAPPEDVGAWFALSQFSGLSRHNIMVLSTCSSSPLNTTTSHSASASEALIINQTARTRAAWSTYTAVTAHPVLNRWGLIDEDLEAEHAAVVKAMGPGPHPFFDVSRVGFPSPRHLQFGRPNMTLFIPKLLLAHVPWHYFSLDATPDHCNVNLAANFTRTDLREFNETHMFIRNMPVRSVSPLDAARANVSLCGANAAHGMLWTPLSTRLVSVFRCPFGWALVVVEQICIPMSATGSDAAVCSGYGRYERVAGFTSSLSSWCVCQAGRNVTNFCGSRLTESLSATHHDVTRATGSTTFSATASEDAFRTASNTASQTALTTALTRSPSLSLSMALKCDITVYVPPPTSPVPPPDGGGTAGRGVLDQPISQFFFIKPSGDDNLLLIVVTACLTAILAAMSIN